MQSPSYDFDTFVHECDAGEDVRVLADASATASRDFGLHTDNAVMSFVAHWMESPTFINSTPLRWTSMGGPVITVDAYSFYSNTTYGYLAFFQGVRKDRWIIKSLKKNRDPDPRFHTMRRAFQLAGLNT